MTPSPTQMSINTFKVLFRLCEFNHATVITRTRAGTRVNYKVIVLLTTVFDAVVELYKARPDVFLGGAYKGEKYIQINNVMFMRDNHTYQKYVEQRFKDSDRRS